MFKRNPLLDQLSDMMNNVELIILDIDGTVLQDTHLQYWKHLNKASNEHAGKSWSDEAFMAYLTSQGYTTRQHIVSTMIGEDPTAESERVKTTMAYFYESFCKDTDKSELHPHIVSAVRAFTEKGIPTIAFSDTEEILVKKMLLSDHNLHGHFEKIVGGAKKPDATVLHHTLQRRESQPKLPGKNVLVIGDNLKTDGALAKAANCQFVYFADGDKKASAFEDALAQEKIPSDSLMIRTHKAFVDALVTAHTPSNVDNAHQELSL